MLQAIDIGCTETNRQFLELKRQKVHPKNMEEHRAKVSQCLAEVHIGCMEKCTDEVAALRECYDQNPKSFYKCQDVKNILAKCAGKNRIGELANM
eukprot:scaffold194688_cov50-Attheya_sp.AAC.2